MSSPATDVDAATALLDALTGAVDALAKHATAPRAGDAVALAAGVARAMSRLEAVQVLLAERLVTTDAARATGWASVKDLLTHLHGGHKGAGGAIVRLGEQTRALPQLREAMLGGDVSTAQARTIARRCATLPAAAPGLRADAAGLMLGQVARDRLDATDLDRAFGDVLATLDPDGRLLGGEQDLPRAERGAHHARHLALTPDEVGGVRIRGYASVEDAELIAETLAPLTKPVIGEPGGCGGDPDTLSHLGPDGRRLDAGCPAPGCAHDGRDPREHGVRLLDAVVELCRRAQAASPRASESAAGAALPSDHGTTSRITVTIGFADLRDQLGSGLLGSGQSLSAQAVRRLACDAEILPAVLGARGEILDIGRTRRLVTTALWLALVLRDRHCSFPGCTRPPRACDAHHIVHWADGGVTSLDNLALLCRHHHTLTHRSPWRLDLHPDTRRPRWTPPPETDDRSRFTYRPATGPPLRSGSPPLSA